MAMQPDVLGQALQDYWHQRETEALILHTSYGDVEEMPIDVFFRPPDEFPELERLALTLCRGHILDVGAGAGSHALWLQARGLSINALEQSPLACTIMRERGVRAVLQQDFFAYHHPGAYDTLLFMMNGIGLAGTLDGLKTLLRHGRSLLRERGQLLIDSSDIAYLYSDGSVEKPRGYYGEIRYQYEYRGLRGEPFQWLFVDQETLIRLAETEGWAAEVLYEDENEQYLARLKPLNR